jgi:hypothetical protein
MKNEVTYQQAIDMLNDLCQGLGDAFNNNVQDNSSAIYGFNVKKKYTLYGWIWNGFVWDFSPEKHDKWREIVNILLDIED